MAVEYYVKRRSGNGKWVVVETCETSEQAQRQMKLYNDRNKATNYIVVYSADAIIEWQKRRAS